MGQALTRLDLSVAIIVSLVPHQWMHANDRWFLVIFAPEFVVRVLLAFWHPGDQVWRRPGRGDVGLLFVDFIALVSFMPISQTGVAATRWLRLFRLSRTLILLRYWAPLLRDLQTVLFQRDRAKQMLLMATSVAIVAFAGTVALNHLTDATGADFDGDGVAGNPHDHEFLIRLWWAFRQIEDPGNMLAEPHDAGTLIVSIFLTVMGLFLVAVLIGVGADIVHELMALTKLRPAGMAGHTVVVNINPSTRKLLFELLEEARKLLPEGLTFGSLAWFKALRDNLMRGAHFVVVGHSVDPPDFLREPELNSIVYHQNDPEDDDELFLARADVPFASRVVLLADSMAENPDEDTIRTLVTVVERLREEPPSGSRRKLVAEILDESNVPTAHRAIDRLNDVEARIVPTERIMALFMSCVARRPGVDVIVLELLQSRGWELYTYDYRESGTAPPDWHATAAMKRLFSAGAVRQQSHRVLPVGVLVEDASGETKVRLNPLAEDDRADEALKGFVALAPNLRVAHEFAAETRMAASTELPRVPSALPTLKEAATTPFDRVLICGFRPATVNLIEALVGHYEHAQILVLVDDEAAKRDALDGFDAHLSRVSRGRLRESRGSFELDANGVLNYRPPGGETVRGSIRVEVGDWTSSRELRDLPADFGAVPDCDLVVLISSHRRGADSRTTTALMKLEDLAWLAEQEGHPPAKQRIVAEVASPDLARRMRRRYDDMGRDNVRVFSTEELRALFLFQSVIVAEFDAIFGELLMPSGVSLVRLEVDGPGVGHCGFPELAASIFTQGALLFAVEVGSALYVAHGSPDDDRVDLAKLSAVWVLQR
jgi:hypothetical protein